MRKLSQITESVWADIHKRSNGIQVKREDDVNRMDFNTFYDHLELKYKDKYVHITRSNTWICVILEYSINLIVHYSNNKIKDIRIESLDEHFFSSSKEFEENFKLVYKGDSKFEIKDKNNTVTNETVDKFIELFYNSIISDDEFKNLNSYCKQFAKTITNDVNITCDQFIDFLLSQINKHGGLKPVKITDFVRYNWDDILKLIKQESTGLEESVWSDIHRRSNGEQMRKEDKISFSSLDDGNISNLFTYITQNYKSIYPKYDAYCVNGNIIIPITSDYSKLMTVTQYFFQGDENELEYVVVTNDLVDKIDPELYDYTEKDFGSDIQTKIIVDDVMPKSRFVQILDSILENVPNPVLKKIGDVKESVWADIHKRSNGIQVKKEDDINHLDQDGLFDYINDNYVPTGEYGFDKEPLEKQIDVPFLLPEIASYGYTAVLKFEKSGIVLVLSKDMKEECPDVYNLIKDNYMISDFDRYLFSIYPKNGPKKIDNKFFIDFLDFLIDNVKDTDKEKLIIKKK